MGLEKDSLGGIKYISYLNIITPGEKDLVAALSWACFFRMMFRSDRLFTYLLPSSQTSLYTLLLLSRLIPPGRDKFYYVTVGSFWGRLAILPARERSLDRRAECSGAHRNFLEGCRSKFGVILWKKTKKLSAHKSGLYVEWSSTWAWGSNDPAGVGVHLCRRPKT